MFDLVSILIPAYNAEKWISDTIKSALDQTWQNKEIIIVDDGSTDNTLQIAKEFESKSVKVISQENRGSCSARNKALSFAQGDYIQYLDADDLLAPDKISKQLEGRDSGLSSNILLSSAFAKFFFRYKKAVFIPDPLWQDFSPVNWLITKFTENEGMLDHTWLVSRRLTELAGPWDERLSLDDDGEYSCRIVSLSKMVKFVPEAKCYWRVGNYNSLVNDISDKALESFFLSISLCINYLLSLEDSERTRYACLKHLENQFMYFYPDNHEILEKANNLTRKLGGNLLTPTENWRFFIFRKVLGWKVAKYMKYKIGKAKKLTRKNWDRLLYSLSIE